MSGAEDNDVLFGATGNDTLSGNGGDDVLNDRATRATLLRSLLGRRATLTSIEW